MPGARGEIDLLQLMTRTGARVRFHLPRPIARRKGGRDGLVESQALPLVAAQRIRVPIQEVFALDDVEAAYARFAAGTKFGKIILDISA